MTKIQPTPEITEKIISLYLSGKDTYETASIIGCSQTFIMNTLKRNNIPRRSTQIYTTKYISNENFFDIIDTEEKAYFLGLMYADGNNYVRSPHSYEVSIALMEKDKLILEKLRDLLSTNTLLKYLTFKNTKWSNQYLLRINNKKMSEQLSKLGCVPKKSLILTFPNEDIVPTHLINHFIRGYSDGDGSIYSRIPKNNGYVNYGWQITSTKNFCNSVDHLLSNKLNIHFSKSLVHPKTNQITTTLSVGGNLQVRKVLDWLYQDATIYLPRKYNKYQEFIHSQ